MVIHDKELAAYIDDACKRWGITNLSVSLINGQSYGYSAPPSTKPVDPASTLFYVCSNTKLFTAVAVGILVDQGKLAWSDKIKDRIPGFNWTNAHTTEHITVEDLLCHVNGRLSTNQNWAYAMNTTHADFVALTNKQRCCAELRQRFAYDNQTFSLAGHLIHLVSGMPFADFVTKHIIQPLQMHNTSFDWQLMHEKGATASISLDDGKVVQQLLPSTALLCDDNALLAGGGLVSTSEDLAKWLAYLQRITSNKLTDEDPRVISKKTLLDVLRPKTTSDMIGVVPCKQGESPFMESSTPLYGSGCERFHVHGIDVVCHPGDLAGASNLTFWTPNADFGVVVLTATNKVGHAVAMSIALKAFERHFGIGEVDWESRLRNMPGAFSTGPPPFPRLAAESQRCAEVKRIEDTALFGAYDGPGHGTLHFFDPSSAAQEDPKAVSNLKEALAKAEHLGRPWTQHGDPVALAVWEADVVLTKFFKDLSNCRKHLRIREICDARQLRFWQSTDCTGHVAIGHFEKPDNGLVFEFDTTWSAGEPLHVKTRGQGDITFSKRFA